MSLIAQNVYAEEYRYRIELLVLKHLDGYSQLSPQPTLQDFSTALDLTPPPIEEPENPESQETDELRPVAEPLEEGLLDTEFASDEDQIPVDEPEPQAILIENFSDTMQQAWRRLRLSGSFRPELQLVWEQAEDGPFPLVRIHDAEILLEEDPYSEQRANLENTSIDGVPTFTDTNTSPAVIKGSQDSMNDEDGFNEAVEPELVTLPEPTLFYRIDGTARMRKTRFLHLDLDIEFREPLFDVDTSAIPPVSQESENEASPRPSAFLVHAVRQSRQVQTQDLEYFDGAVIAVLALISRVEVVETPGEEVLTQ